MSTSYVCLYVVLTYYSYEVMFRSGVIIVAVIGFFSPICYGVPYIFIAWRVLVGMNVASPLIKNFTLRDYALIIKTWTRMTFLNIVNGRQFVYLGENILRSKKDIKFCNRLLYIALESLSNETNKFLMPFSFKKCSFAEQER